MLCCTDPEQLASFVKRDLDQCKLLAHLTVGGTCPGCDKEIVEKVSNKATQVQVAKPGMPQPRGRVDGKSHLQAHQNQRTGTGPLIDVPLARWVLCVLHLHLRIVGALFKSTILEVIGKFHVKGVKNCDDTGTVAELIFNFLTDEGIHVKKKTDPGNVISTFYNSISKHSFHGGDCSVMERIWERLCEMNYPASMCDVTSPTWDRDVASRKKNVMKIWAMWFEEIWPLINNSELDKEAHASKVEVEGIKFLKLWKKVIGDTTHLYPHMLVAHLPDQIRELSGHITLYQTSGLEHKHSWRKLWRKLTNKHKERPTAEVAYHLVKGFMRNGGYVPGFVRRIGKSRTVQLHEISLLDDKLRDLFDDARRVKIKNEKSEHSKAVRKSWWEGVKKEIEVAECDSEEISSFGESESESESEVDIIYASSGSEEEESDGECAPAVESAD
jgi:hypothetical protein